MRAIGLFIALAAAPAAAAPGQEAYGILASALGPQATDILGERGYLIRYGDKKLPGLLHVQWTPLLALAERASSLPAFLSLYDKVKSGQALGDDSPDLHALLQLPLAGLWTPGAKASAELLSAHLENLSTMGEQARGAPKILLFRTRWGESFLARTHADLLNDFRPLAEPFFRDFLAAPDRPAEAPAHFLSHVKSVYEKDIASALERDLASARLSDELAGWIAKYLLDQKRLWNASLPRERLAALERSSSLSKDLRDLRAVAVALKDSAQALSQTRAALRKEDSSARIRFSSEKLHVYSETGPLLDEGDWVTLTAAYWVESEDPAAAVSVTEAGFLDEEASGVAQASVSSYRRKVGGPYIFSQRILLTSAGKHTFRLLLGGPEAEPLRLETDIDASPRLHEMLASAAHAQALVADCRLGDAVAELSGLDSALSPLAGKSQFKKLKGSLQPLLKTLAQQARTREALIGTIPGARLRASKEQCEFNPERAKRALAYLASLPPGCDRAVERVEGGAAAAPLSEELSALFSATERRRLAQEAFRSALGRARREEDACRPKEAASLYAAGLALLDSDPETRCGAWEAEYALTRSNDLPRARSAGAIAQSFTQSYQEGARLFSAGDYAGALIQLNGLIARIDEMPDGRCFEGQRRKAQDLSLAAGVSLAPPSPKSISSSLPKDPVNQEVHEVSAESGKRARAEDSDGEEKPRPGPAPKSASKPKAPPRPALEESSDSIIMSKEYQEKVARRKAAQEGQ